LMGRLGDDRGAADLYCRCRHAQAVYLILPEIIWRDP
jgi:hypothetical protein